MKIFLNSNEIAEIDNIEDLEFLVEEYEVEVSSFDVVRNKRELNQQREKLLVLGAISEDGKMWFNQRTAEMFISGLATLEEDETIYWRDANREIIELTYAEARLYSKEIRIVLQEFYGLME